MRCDAIHVFENSIFNFTIMHESACMGVFSFGLTGGIGYGYVRKHVWMQPFMLWGMGCGLCGADRSPYFPSLLFLFLSVLLFIFSLRPSVCPFSPLHAYVSRNTYYILLEKLIARELGAMHAYMYCIWPNLHLLPIEMLRVRGKKIVVFDLDFQIFLILGRLIRLGRCRCRGWNRPQSGIITITVCVCVCVCLSHFPMSRSVLSFMSLSVTKMMKRSLLSPIIHHMRYDHRFPHVHNTNIQNKNNIRICIRLSPHFIPYFIHSLSLWLLLFIWVINFEIHTRE